MSTASAQAPVYRTPFALCSRIGHAFAYELVALPRAHAFMHRRVCDRCGWNMSETRRKRLWQAFVPRRLAEAAPRPARAKPRAP